MALTKKKAAPRPKTRAQIQAKFEKTFDIEVDDLIRLRCAGFLDSVGVYNGVVDGDIDTECNLGPFVRLDDIRYPGIIEKLQEGRKSTKYVRLLSITGVTVEIRKTARV